MPFLSFHGISHFLFRTAADSQVNEPSLRLSLRPPPLGAAFFVSDCAAPVSTRNLSSLMFQPPPAKDHHPFPVHPLHLTYSSDGGKKRSVTFTTLGGGRRVQEKKPLSPPPPSFLLLLADFPWRRRRSSSPPSSVRPSVRRWFVSFLLPPMRESSSFPLLPRLRVLFPPPPSAFLPTLP